jgi:hypothetical protein
MTPDRLATLKATNAHARTLWSATSWQEPCDLLDANTELIAEVERLRYELDTERDSVATCMHTIDSFRMEVVSLGERHNAQVDKTDAALALLCECQGWIVPDSTAGRPLLKQIAALIGGTK